MHFQVHPSVSKVLIYRPFRARKITAGRPSFHLRQGAGGGVDDEAADGDVLGDQRVVQDGIDRAADRLLRVVCAFLRY